MLGKKSKIDKTQIEMFSIDQLVPRDHLVRKLDAALDLSFIYSIVSHLYSHTGTTSIDPVVLIKLNIIQYTFGIRSMRQTIKETEVNLAYRWFIGYGLTEKIPHFSTFSKNYERRFKNTNLFEQIFTRVVSEIYNKGIIEENSIFIDGTHIKANANNHRHRKATIEKSSRWYEEQLQEEIAKDREEQGKNPLKNKDDDDNPTPPPTKEIKQSTTDPDSGVFHKGEHRKVFAYTAHVACDKNAFILGFETTAGNVHDSTVLPLLYNKLKEKYSTIRNVVLDAGYKIPAIAKLILDDNKIPIMPYKRPMTKEGFFKKYEYTYDEYFNCYICPNNQILKYSTTNREGYREYKSNPFLCEACPMIKKCTNSKNHTKLITRHIWEEYIEKVEDIRHTTGYKKVYQKRKETIERVFADAKELHGMRYARHRGLAKIKMELNLLFTCMNLKKLAYRVWKKRTHLDSFRIFIIRFA